MQKIKNIFVRPGGRDAERKFRRGKGLCLGLIKKKSCPGKKFKKITKKFVTFFNLARHIQ